MTIEEQLAETKKVLDQVQKRLDKLEQLGDHVHASGYRYEVRVPDPDGSGWMVDYKTGER
jgi:hypothetical protein